MTDDKQDPSVVAWRWSLKEGIRHWHLEPMSHDQSDIASNGVEIQNLSLTSDLTAMKAELEEAKKERDMFEHAASALSTDLFDFDERLRAAEQERDELREALSALLRCEYEAAGHGLTDCIDNHGKPYQSADLDACIKRAEALVAHRALSKPKPHDEGGLRSISEDGR